ncbi:MAG TPA: glycosyl hydrolase family 18 protein [Kofleriaceae bacterium]|nr:glycosyl hydrolase family 18 protein [Kofleriaceae bacterium]
MNHRIKLDSLARHGRASLVLPGALLLLGIGAASGCRGPADGGARPAPSSGEAPASEAPSEEAALRKYERFGYYPARARYDEGFRIKDIATTGMAGRLTVLAYGFGSIDPSTLTCHDTGGGDTYVDYRKPFDAESSVGGVADPAVEDVPGGGGPLRGNFNQLKQLKAQFPHLKVVISLGGRASSELFSDIAATDASRRKFVSSCIDLYIRGNLPAAHGSGGPGSASGVFDGFDLAWQWPADKANHALLLQELRRQLDELAGSSRYLLTTLLPADPARIAAGIDLGSVFQAVDFGNVQAYDFHGPWEPRRTYHHAQLATSPSDPTLASARLSGDGAIHAYLSAGVAPDRLTLGLPLYGYGWTGVCKGLEDGLFQEASGVASGTTKPGTAPVKELLRQFAPEQLEPGAQVADPKDYLVYDPVAIAAYGYNGSTFWSFDDADILEIKAAYIQTKGLRGAMLWSLDGDDGSLVRVLDRTLNANLSE